VIANTALRLPTEKQYEAHEQWVSLYLPTSLDAVKILTKRTPQDPELGQAKFIRLLNLGRPHIDGRLGTVVLVTLNVRYRMLKSSTKSC
jgi:hypothetical protein